MKKVSIFMAIAAAASLASCTAQSPKANLSTELDSPVLFYRYGSDSRFERLPDRPLGC